VRGDGIADPPPIVEELPDREDSRILGLAAAAGAFLIVSAAQRSPVQA